MKDQIRILAWMAIGLSLGILGYMLMSYQLRPGEIDTRGLFIFSFLIPIGIAVFFLSSIESAIVGVAVLFLCAWIFIQPQYIAMPYSSWPMEMGFTAYIGFLLKPLFTSGVIWELIAFLILSYWAGLLYESLKRKTAQFQDSAVSTQDTSMQLESERARSVSLRKKYEEDLNHLNSLIITLSDLAKEIPSVLEVEGLLKLILDKTIKLLSANSCAIFSVDNVSNKLSLACSVGYDENMLKDLKLTADEESGIVGWAAKNGKFLSLKEAQMDSHMADLLRQDKFPVIFCQPIVERGRSIAVICVGELGNEIDEKELIRLTSLLANLSFIAIENAQLMEKTKERALRDGLTGLYNHRHFYELLDEMMKKVKRENFILGNFMIDIDHFKKFNDTYGHQTGDLILQETAKIVQSNVKKEDVAARYGGEEFAVVCMRKDISQIGQLAEDTRKAAENMEFQVNGLKLKITISLGIAFYDPKKETVSSASELVRRSDSALYKAKEGGRNRVCIYE